MKEKNISIKKIIKISIICVFFEVLILFIFSMVSPYLPGFFWGC